MASFVVVLDACVLIPSVLRDTLLRAAERNLYRLRWSDEILDEMVRVLGERQITRFEQANRLRRQMELAFPEATASPGYKSLSPELPNPEHDRHVLAAAIQVKAQVIVTTNLRHFPIDALDPFNIEAQSPDIFLTHQFHLSQGTMLELLHEQAADLRKRVYSVDDILASLHSLAPRFVELVQRARAGPRPEIQ